MGKPEAALPIIHFAFFAYSELVSQLIREKGYTLYGASDARFLKIIYTVGYFRSHAHCDATVSHLLMPTASQNRAGLTSAQNLG